MNKAHKFAFFLLFIVILSCTEEKKEITSTDSIIVPKLDTIQIENELLEVKMIVSNEDYILFISPSVNDGIFKVFSSDLTEHLGSFGTKGEGPNEFNQIIYSSLIVADEHLIVTDMKNIRLFDLKGNFEKRIDDIRPSKTIRIPEKLIPLNGLIYIDENTIGGQVDFSLNEFTFQNLETKETFEKPDYPTFVENIPATAKHHLYQSNLTQHPDKALIATIYRNFPKMRIYDYNTNNHIITSFDAKNKQVAVKVTAQESSVKSFDLVKYQRTVKSNQNYIVSLYNESKVEKVFDEENPERYQYEMKTLAQPLFQIVDWEGAHIASVEIPEWANTYTVLSNDKILLFHPEVSSELYVIDINKLN